MRNTRKEEGEKKKEEEWRGIDREGDAVRKEQRGVTKSPPSLPIRILKYNKNTYQIPLFRRSAPDVRNYARRFQRRISLHLS